MSILGIAKEARDIVINQCSNVINDLRKSVFSPRALDIGTLAGAALVALGVSYSVVATLFSREVSWIRSKL